MIFYEKINTVNSEVIAMLLLLYEMWKDSNKNHYNSYLMLNNCIIPGADSEGGVGGICPLSLPK